MNVISSNIVRQAAQQEGFSLCGIARARVLEERRDDLFRFFESGFEGEMGWLRRDWERRLDPSFIVPAARTVIVCAVNHKNEASLAQADDIRIASYIYARDYHVSVREMLRGVAGRIAAAGFRMRGVCDTAPILEKAWAVEAGLGGIGKNSLLITPQFGSFVSLGLLVTDAECDEYDSDRLPATDAASDVCGTCTRCIDACPNGAIVAPRVIDARRCNAYLTLEVASKPHMRGGHVSVGMANEANPSGEPPAVNHTWIAGCDVCQSVCPHNRATPLYSNTRFAPLMPAPAPAEFWHGLTREQFDELLSNTVLARRGFDELAAQIGRVV